MTASATYSAALEECYTVVVRYNTGEAVSVRPTFRLCNRSWGTKAPLFNAGYIEHVNSPGYLTAVL